VLLIRATHNGYTGLFDVNLSSGQQAEGSFPRDDIIFSANSENLWYKMKKFYFELPNYFVMSTVSVEEEPSKSA